MRVNIASCKREKIMFLFSLNYKSYTLLSRIFGALAQLFCFLIVKSQTLYNLMDVYQCCIRIRSYICK